tara:strand:+ start:72 stop:224 length:153 start_codon:yes stop_codon:yes gene_type:complete
LNLPIFFITKKWRLLGKQTTTYNQIAKNISLLSFEAYILLEQNFNHKLLN